MTFRGQKEIKVSRISQEKKAKIRKSQKTYISIFIAVSNTNRILHLNCVGVEEEILQTDISNNTKSA